MQEWWHHPMLFLFEIHEALFLIHFKNLKLIKKWKSKWKMKTPNSLCDGGWSTEDCTLIKAFLFWNSNRKRWKHQFLVWFSALALSEGSLSHVALSFSLLAFANLILIFIYFFAHCPPSLRSPPCKITEGSSVQRRFSNSAGGFWGKKGNFM